MSLMMLECRYMDGEIVREGPIGDTNQGAFSTGVSACPKSMSMRTPHAHDRVQRGGTGNIGSPGMKPVHRDSQDVIPETAMRPSMEDRDYHVGVCDASTFSIAIERGCATDISISVEVKATLIWPMKRKTRLRTKGWPTS